MRWPFDAKVVLHENFLKPLLNLFRTFITPNLIILHQFECLFESSYYKFLRLGEWFSFPIGVISKLEFHHLPAIPVAF